MNTDAIDLHRFIFLIIHADPLNQRLSASYSVLKISVPSVNSVAKNFLSNADVEY